MADEESIRPAWLDHVDGTGPVDHYDELAPVYDFVIGRRHDHDAMAAFVADRLPVDASAVCVGGSGPGRLLARVADRYDEAVGVDLSPAMCDLAAVRTDAEVVEGDVREYGAGEGFDGYTLLGNTLAHLSAGDVPTFLGTARGALRDGGVLVLDFTPTGDLVNGYVRADSFASDRVQVDRTRVVTVEDRDPDALGTPARYTYSYDVTDRQADRTVTTGTSEPVRAFDPPALLGAALGAGFADVSLLNPPTSHRGGLLARVRE
jgi:SAM-dependent methyltransferase